MSGKRVILSGTSSLSLVQSTNHSLYHRAVVDDVTHISYKESVNTVGFSLKEYLEMGGLYRCDALKDLDGLRNYVNTSVVDNILESLSKNDSSFKISESALRTLVFKILYSVIYSRVKNIPCVNISYMINLFEHDYLDKSALSSTALETLDLDADYKPTDSEVVTVLRMLISIGILIKIRNKADNKGVQYIM